MSNTYLYEALESASATLYADEQQGFDAERLCYQSDFAGALDTLNKQDGDNTNFGDVARRIAPHERLNQFEKAAQLRGRIERARDTAFGDYWPATDVDKAAPLATEQSPPAQAASKPTRRAPTRKRSRAADAEVDSNRTPGLGPDGSDVDPPAR